MTVHCVPKRKYTWYSIQIYTCRSKMKVRTLEMPAALKSGTTDLWTARRNLSTLVAVFYWSVQKLNVSEKQLGCQMEKGFQFLMKEFYVTQVGKAVLSLSNCMQASTGKPSSIPARQHTSQPECLLKRDWSPHWMLSVSLLMGTNHVPHKFKTICIKYTVYSEHTSLHPVASPYCPFHFFPPHRLAESHSSRYSFHNNLTLFRQRWLRQGRTTICIRRWWVHCDS